MQIVLSGGDSADLHFVYRIDLSGVSSLVIVDPFFNRTVEFGQPYLDVGTDLSGAVVAVAQEVQPPRCQYNRHGGRSTLVLFNPTLVSLEGVVWGSIGSCLYESGFHTTLVAIRKPDELTPDLMVEWSKKEIGSRIVVTGTGAKNLEDLANEAGSYGVLSAIETVAVVRSHIITLKMIGLASASEESSPLHAPSYPGVYVSCFETIREAMLTLDDMPLGWIHLGHGSDGKLEGDGIARLSNGEEDDTWTLTEKISAMIANGVGSMLFCILPVCHSSQSGDVLQSNPNILAIHATRTDSPHSLSEQLVEMPEWWRVSELNITPAGINIHNRNL